MALNAEPGQLLAVRELAEGKPATYGRLAAVLNLPTKTLQQYGRRHGWAKVDCRKGPVREADMERRPPWDDPWDPAGAGGEAGLDDAAEAGSGAGNGPAEPMDVRLNRLAERLLAEAEAIGTQAGRRGRTLDKARIDALWTAIRALEKVEGFLRDRAGDMQAAQEEEMADALRRIDERIEELARAYARELVAEQLGGGESEPAAGLASPR